MKSFLGLSLLCLSALGSACGASRTEPVPTKAALTSAAAFSPTVAGYQVLPGTTRIDAVIVRDNRRQCLLDTSIDDIVNRFGNREIKCCINPLENGGCPDLTKEVCLGTLASVCAVEGEVPKCYPDYCICSGDGC